VADPPRFVLLHTWPTVSPVSRLPRIPPSRCLTGHFGCGSSQMRQLRQVRFLHLAPVYRVQEGGEFRGAVDDCRDRAGSGPFFEAGALERGRLLAWSLELDLEMHSAPEAANIRIAGGGHGGTVALAVDQGGVGLAQALQVVKDALLQVAFEGLHACEFLRTAIAVKKLIVTSNSRTAAFTQRGGPLLATVLICAMMLVALQTVALAVPLNVTVLAP
jgi:hypothetical protein